MWCKTPCLKAVGWPLLRTVSFKYFNHSSHIELLIEELISYEILNQAFDEVHINWATSWQNQQNDCAPSEDSDQLGYPPSLIRVFLCTQWVAMGPRFLQTDSEDSWSDWADAQADLSLRWAHMPFCLFCHEAAQFVWNNLDYRIRTVLNMMLFKGLLYPKVNITLSPIASWCHTPVPSVM